MFRTVTAGIDASPESLAAAEWAAREASLRALPLRLVNVWEPVPEPMGREPVLGPGTGPPVGAEVGPVGVGRSAWRDPGVGKVLREAADGIRSRHAGLDVRVEQLAGRASEELVGVAHSGELLVLGSRGLSGIAGFLLGSVGLHVVAHTERPVVLVRAGERASDEHVPGPAGGPGSPGPAGEGTEPGTEGEPGAGSPFRPVVLGLDTVQPDHTLIRFAFEAALVRGTTLRILHDWRPPPHSGLRERPELEADLDADVGQVEAGTLTEVLVPWRREFPGVEVVEESRRGKAAEHLLAASRDACLVVVGRRVRHSPVGAHIGPVVHAVLHHAGVPVAVVAHE
ncbi:MULTISPECIES: universal stress protein [Streptomyces]|uniref:Universal stress protein n=1 Tax=Streptomyces griseiscabiei TaxID=2993540 RepID=A0ABU4LH18_9ACTN|nr:MULTISPECIES: universal stress protein [Streptomyces]MBZ3902141.1 universal stress protein [Streptomyces griseiscabiei]MDX2914469.1 universal stress protein [Streptomyces griseiscabiei]